MGKTRNDGAASAWTRRRFLSRIGEAGSAAALYESMAALGLVAVPPAWSGPPALTAGQGEGKSVAPNTRRIVQGHG